jgi:hypothetical protein
MTIDNFKTIVDILSGILSGLVILTAAWWFFFTRKAERRVQFDLDCKFFNLSHTSEYTVVELQFIFENHGQVVHRLYNLEVSVHALNPNNEMRIKENSRELSFDRVLIPKTKVIPRKYSRFSIRPGVRQVITYICALNKPGEIIRVTSGFSYDKNERYVHTARRLFSTSTK